MLDNVSNFPLSITSRTSSKLSNRDSCVVYKTNNKSRYPIAIRDPKGNGFQLIRTCFWLFQKQTTTGDLCLVWVRPSTNNVLSLSPKPTHTQKNSLINLNTLINANCKVNCCGCPDDYKLNKHAAAPPDQSKRRVVLGVKFLPTDSFIFTRIHPAAHTNLQLISSLQINTFYLIFYFPYWFTTGGETAWSVVNISMLQSLPKINTAKRRCIWLIGFFPHMAGR